MNCSWIVRFAVMSTAVILSFGCGDVECEDFEGAELTAMGKHLLCRDAEPPDGSDDEERVVFLGALGSDLGSVAHAINEQGTVVGWSNLTPFSPQVYSHAFRWDSKTGMAALPTLGGEGSIAYDVNNHDEIVGYAHLPDGTPRAVLWDADGEIHDLGTLGGASSVAYAINNVGQVVGWTETDFRPTFFIWDDENGMRDLVLDVDMQAGGWGHVNDINDDGVVVGSISPGKFSDWPFKWSEEGGQVDLETLGYTRGEATAINAGGDIVGFMYTHSYELETEGFKWTGAGTTKVAALPGSGPNTYVRGVNDHGIMVGGARVPETESTGATQWDTSMTPRVLPLGEHPSSANDINNRGQVVGIYGDPAAAPEAFVWFPGN